METTRQQRRYRKRAEQKTRDRLVRLRRIVLAAGAAAVAGAAQANIITVNSTADNTTAGDTKCTLREALANANSNSDTTTGDCAAGSGPDVINFNLPNPSTIAIAGEGGAFVISDSLYIKGPGQAALTISGSNVSRVFYIFNGSQNLDVTMSGLTIAQGHSTIGGSGIFDNGENLTLKSVTLSGNSASAALQGQSGASLSLQQSTITGTTGGQGIVGRNLSGLTIAGPSTISYNVGGGRGGGIALYSGSGPVLIDDTTITGNQALVGGGVFLYRQNGLAVISNSQITGNTGVFAAGGVFLYGNLGPTSISATTISQNTSTYVGGGVLIQDPLAPIVIDNSNISENSSNNGGGVFLYQLYADVTIQDTTISGNMSDESGAGIAIGASAYGTTFRLQGSTVSGNIAGNVGGGIYLYFYGGLYGATVIENSTISGNSAYVGGGIGSGSLYGYSVVDIHNTTINGNTATLRDGNANFANFPYVTIRNSIIANGTAPTNPDMETAPSNVQMNYSLLENPAGATVSGTGNIIGQDPMVGPLADNGGPTLTHLPLAGSPVINAGDPAFVPPPATDQRGLPRVAGTPVPRIDMGSVEVQPVVVANADVSISKTGPTSGFVGQPITYTITVTNAGPGSASSVTVTDTMPANTTFGSANPTQGTCTGGSPTLTCMLGTITNGNTATIQLTITPTAPGALSNTASVAATEPDTNMANNVSTSAPATIAPAALIPTLGAWARIMLAISVGFLGLFMVKKE